MGCNDPLLEVQRKGLLQKREHSLIELLFLFLLGLCLLLAQTQLHKECAIRNVFQGCVDLLVKINFHDPEVYQLGREF